MVMPWLRGLHTGKQKASLFENLLRESDKEGYLDRLRQEGVTEDDIKEAGDAWLLGYGEFSRTKHGKVMCQRGAEIAAGAYDGVRKQIQVVVPSSPDLQEESQQTSEDRDWRWG